MSDLPDVIDKHIKRVEGGFQKDPEDPGNWTGGKVGEGLLVGTKYGISAAANPDVDILNLTWEQAEDLYFDRYWIPSGARSAWSKNHKALALMLMDSALHSGVQTAKDWFEEANGDYMLATAYRVSYLASLVGLWARWGRGWMKRIATLMITAASLESGVSERVMNGVCDLLVDNRSWWDRLLSGRMWGPVAFRVRPMTSAEGTKIDVRRSR